MPWFGGIEAGGTKFLCALGRGPDDLHTQVQFATRTPQETITQAIEFFRRQEVPIAAVGIGSFGPLDPNPKSPTYGYITTTPKPGWAHTDFAGRVQRALKVPVGFDTDVNAAALGEHLWGAAQDVDSFVYMTVGTGIGGGLMVGGVRQHGLTHPEMGHIRIPHDRQKDPFAGSCPYHQDCLEGLAAGPALEARWGQRGETVPADHPAWPLEAEYLALRLVSIICTVSPQRIVLGGGVMAAPGLLARVRARVLALLNGYIQAPALLDRIESYLVAPGLGRQAGVLGALALARQSMPR